MNKQDTQKQFEALCFMHENRCMACNGSGVAHIQDPYSEEEITEPCPNCQDIKNHERSQEQQEDYIDVYAEEPRSK